MFAIFSKTSGQISIKLVLNDPLDYGFRVVKIGGMAQLEPLKEEKWDFFCQT